MNSNWRSALFKSNEIIAYKDAAASPVIPTASKGTQFFVINPLKEIRGGNFLTNISARRNFLVEFDGGQSCEDQWKYVESIRLPFAVCTYSGGKSLHFIVALEESLDEETYYQFSKLLVNMVEGADKLINPNRAARLPGATRDNGVEQELIEVRAPITLERLTNWIFFGPLAKKAHSLMRTWALERDAELKAKAEKQARKESGEERLTIPRIYRDMQTDGLVHPEAKGRHESLVKFGVWLLENDYDYDEIAHELQLAAIGLGVDDRQDDKNVLRWLFNKRKRS